MYTIFNLTFTPQRWKDAKECFKHNMKSIEGNYLYRLRSSIILSWYFFTYPAGSFGEEEKVLNTIRQQGFYVEKSNRKDYKYFVTLGEEYDKLQLQGIHLTDFKKLYNLSKSFGSQLVNSF